RSAFGNQPNAGIAGNRRRRHTRTASGEDGIALWNFDAFPFIPPLPNVLWSKGWAASCRESGLWVSTYSSHLQLRVRGLHGHRGLVAISVVLVANFSPSSRV